LYFKVNAYFSAVPELQSPVTFNWIPMYLNKIYSIRVALTVAIVALSLLYGCQSKYSKYDFKNHKFDRQVIERLPLYDSLSWVLVRYFPSIEQHFKNGMLFQYITSKDGNDLYQAYPKEGADKIKGLLNKLGGQFIYGFQVFKDTTMKFFISDTYIQEYNVDIFERLSFFPRADSIKHKEPPTKDTILNKHWQYWIQFDERVDLF